MNCLFEPEQKHHQMQMLILSQLDFFSKKKISQDYQMIFVIFRIDFVYYFKLDFSQTLSLQTMVCLKAKSLSKKRDTTTDWKSHQENYDSQTKLRLTKNPTITCRVLTISHNIEFTSYCSRLHNVKTKRDKRTAKKTKRKSTNCTRR